MPLHTFTVHYTEALVGAAVRAFVWRRAIVGFGWSGLIALVLFAVGAAADINYGDRGWVLGVFLAVPVFLLIMLLTVWIAHYRNSLGKLRAMKTPQAQWALADETWMVAADTGSATMPWSAITDIWMLPGFWMLFTGISQFVTLPTADVPQAALDFIHQKTRKSRA